MSERIRLSGAGDLPALKALWKQAFDDTDAEIDRYFAAAWKPDQMYVLEEDGRLLSMASWFPQTLCAGRRGWRAAYLYAVATDESARGRGCCRRLLDFAAQTLRGQGVKCLCLLPASKSLYGFYGKLGFSRAFYHGTFTCEAQSAVSGEAIPATAPEYLEAREALLADRVYLSCPVPFVEYQKLLCTSAGGGLFLLSDAGCTGCACAARIGERAEIFELLWPGDPKAAASMVCRALGVRSAFVRVPEGKESFGMIRWLVPAPELPAAYLGLALE